MATIDRSLIADMPLFSGFGAAQLDSVLSGAKAARFPKGSAVFEQDGDAHSFFLLLHGCLRVVRLTPDGQQVVGGAAGR
jgi:CRP/FNR family transcriptional regulator, nitrogen oxide reductase regulator